MRVPARVYWGPEMMSAKKCVSLQVEITQNVDIQSRIPTSFTTVSKLGLFSSGVRFRGVLERRLSDIIVKCVRISAFERTADCGSRICSCVKKIDFVSEGSAFTFMLDTVEII